MIIEVINPVYCQVPVVDISLIKPCLKFQNSWYYRGKTIKTRDGKIRKVGGKDKFYDDYFINKKTGIFLTGFLPRVFKYCDQKSIPYEVKKEASINLSLYMLSKLSILSSDPFSEIKTPSLPGITFKPFQLDLINKIKLNNRGVILSPTGSGKTIIAMGIISMFPKARVLFLCHSIAILRQTQSNFLKFGFKDTSFVGSGEKDLSGQIVIASIKSMISIPIGDYEDLFDIVIIDEIHHLSGRKVSYYQFMETMYAPIRLGFTATMPNKKEALLCIEGSLGPVIGELKINKGIELGIVAKPFITLIPVPMTNKIVSLTKYKDIYLKGIVQNRPRNRLIVSNTFARVKQDKTVLILVKEIDHGDILKELAKTLFDLDCTYIQGSTNDTVREEVRTAFSEKKIKVVICTVIWKEGIDIPSLNCVINAAGGKSEIGTLQAIGRGLRVTDEKDEVEVVDFLDPYKYLSQHTVMRLQIYSKCGWL